MTTQWSITQRGLHVPEQVKQEQLVYQFNLQACCTEQPVVKSTHLRSWRVDSRRREHPANTRHQACVNTVHDLTCCHMTSSSGGRRFGRWGGFKQIGGGGRGQRCWRQQLSGLCTKSWPQFCGCQATLAQAGL